MRLLGRRRGDGQQGPAAHDPGPRVGLVSIEDYQRLQEGGAGDNEAHRTAWLEQTAALAEEILARRHGKPVDVDTIWQQARADLEARDGQTTGR